MNSFIPSNVAIETNDNPNTKFQKELRSTLNECKHITDKNNKWKYINQNPSTPVIRGLVKFTKKTHQFAPIINFRNAPKYNLAKSLTNALKNTYRSPCI